VDISFTDISKVAIGWRSKGKRRYACNCWQMGIQMLIFLIY